MVWSGEVREVKTRVENELVRGREYNEKTGQDELMERYKTLPKKKNSPLR